MKNKIIYVLCAIMIFASIYEITDTYGLFESNKTKQEKLNSEVQSNGRNSLKGDID